MWKFSLLLGISTFTSSHGLALIPKTQLCEDHQIEIVCQGANIQDWTSHGLPNEIQTLRINSTHLTKLPANAFQNFTITKLIIENNPFLQEIDENAFEQVFGLEYVEIRKNTALDIPILFAPFRNLQALQTLILEHNFIRGNDIFTPVESYHLQSLKYLSLQGNPMNEITQNVFAPIATSPLVELNLKDCYLQRIDQGSLSQLKSLQKVDLGQNYKLIQSENDDKENYPQLEWKLLSLADNALFEIPCELLEHINETLEDLDLSGNYFFELNQMPKMKSLQSLNLDDCNINSIEFGTFETLPNLQNLSLKRNKFAILPDGLKNSSLKSLTLSGRQLDFLNELVIPIGFFANMTTLENLEMTRFKIQDTLNKQKFAGLSNLKSLDLSFSNFPSITENAFEHLENLQTLKLSSCSGFEFDFTTLTGLNHLQVIDLSSTRIFVDKIPETLSNIQVLNLSNSMINDDFKTLDFSPMPELVTLDLSGNSIHGWNDRKFESNLKLQDFHMRQNLDYITLSDAMLDDFKNLTFLDLTQNKFLCNREVALFYELAEKSEHLTVRDWYQGFGFVCIQDVNSGNMTSFFEYATGGAEINDPIYPHETFLNGLSTSALAGMVIGTLLVVIVLTSLVSLGYQKWWLVKYKYARWKLIRNNVEDFGGFDKSFDAFVSYAGADQDFIGKTSQKLLS